MRRQKVMPSSRTLCRHLVIATIALVLWPRHAAATTCDADVSIFGSEKRARDIVLAKVTRVTPLPSEFVDPANGLTYIRVSSGTPKKIALAIEDTFKGQLRGDIEILSTVPFTAGERYVIYSSSPSGLDVTPCSRVHLVKEHDSDLKYLSSKRAGQAVGIITGQVYVADRDSARMLTLPEATVVTLSATAIRQDVKAGGWGQFEIVLAPGTNSLWIEQDGQQRTSPEFVTIVDGVQSKSFTATALPGEMARDRRITPTSIGPFSLGMTLQAARHEAPSAAFQRTSDGDGRALVEIVLAPAVSVVVSANEDDPKSPIDWTRTIEWMETFSPDLHIDGLIAAGQLITTAVAMWGPVVDIVRSEIESREFITLERQADGYLLRIDYSGQFESPSRHTVRYRPDGKILSIAIPRPDRY